MRKTAPVISEFFKKKINILVVDDEPAVIDVICETFSSPLFNFYRSATLKKTYSIINTLKAPWHCWILDINIEKKGDGFDILAKYPDFPFAIMLSGPQSMTIASKAMQAGAIGLFDKGPSSVDLFFDGVCKVASLAFVLGGKGGKELDHFILLMTNHFHHPEQWAQRACISLRHLERICTTHTSLSPRFVLSLYYALYCLVSNNAPLFSDLPDASPVKEISGGRDFYRRHLDFFKKNINDYKTMALCHPGISG